MIRKLSMTLILTIVASLAWYANLAQANLVEDGLISYWSFNDSDIVGDTVKDLKGSNDGTVAGDPEIVQGKVGEALYLDGDGDHIDIPDAPDLNTTSEELTICLWLSFKGTLPGNDWPCIMRKGHSSGQNYLFGLWAMTDEIYLTFTPPWQDRRSGLNVKQDDWSYAAMRVNAAADSVSFYVDGATSELALGHAALPTTDADIMIGGGIAADPADLHAVIDELCLYNRSLSDDELRQNQEATGLITAVKHVGKLSTTWATVKTRY